MLRLGPVSISQMFDKRLSITLAILVLAPTVALARPWRSWNTCTGARCELARRESRFGSTTHLASPIPEGWKRGASTRPATMLVQCENCLLEVRSPAI